MSDMSKHQSSKNDPSITTLLLRLTSTTEQMAAKLDQMDAKLNLLDIKVNFIAANLSSLHAQLLQHVNGPGAHHPY